MGKILVTGGNGYIGNALFRRLVAEEKDVYAGCRNEYSFYKSIKTPELSAQSNWVDLLVGFNVVIHVAGLAHMPNVNSHITNQAFRKINTDGTLKLARDAALSGVKRFIFISSISVNGIQNRLGYPFTELDIPNPHNEYGLSKWLAEEGLLSIAHNSKMEVVIVRPPLVYGPDAPGNFGVLMRIVRSGCPLPLGAVNNRRSFIALDNLVDFLVTCIDHPAASGQTFLVSDGEDISTTQLLQKIFKAMNRTALMLPLSERILAFVAKLLGKKIFALSLLGSLQVDIRKAVELLDWKPPLSVDEGLRRAVEQSA